MKLAPKHEGFRVSASGLLGRLAAGKKIERHDRYMLGELLNHLEEMATRYYLGDEQVVDEFLQLYCLDEDRPVNDGSMMEEKP